MTEAYSFNTNRVNVQDKLRNQARAKGYRLDILSFCSDYDKACSSRRGVSLSNRTTSTTGVSVDHTPTPHVDNTGEGNGRC